MLQGSHRLEPYPVTPSDTTPRFSASGLAAAPILSCAHCLIANDSFVPLLSSTPSATAPCIFHSLPYTCNSLHPRH